VILDLDWFFSICTAEIWYPSCAKGFGFRSFRDRDAADLDDDPTQQLPIDFFFPLSLSLSLSLSRVPS
jgi:hypothetical protein